jgi:hypothetical protein
MSSSVSHEGEQQESELEKESTIELAINTYLERIGESYNDRTRPFSEAKIDAMTYALLQLASSYIDFTARGSMFEEISWGMVRRWQRAIVEAELANWGPMISAIRGNKDIGISVPANSLTAMDNLVLSLEEL